MISTDTSLLYYSRDTGFMNTYTKPCSFFLILNINGFLQSLVHVFTSHLCILGNINISNPMTAMDSTLTCTSTGGPATTVTWTRKSQTGDEHVLDNVNNIQVTVLEDPSIAKYIHTLNIAGMVTPATYGCSMSNNKPSSAEATAILHHEGIYMLFIVYCLQGK